jgi:hypothetical protein
MPRPAARRHLNPAKNSGEQDVAGVNDANGEVTTYRDDWAAQGSRSKRSARAQSIVSRLPQEHSGKSKNSDQDYYD